MPPSRPRVDATDFRILAEFFAGDWDGFRSDRVALDEIARKLGLHRNTVSARVRRLTQARVFLPATLEIEAARFGLVGQMLSFEVPREARTPAALEAMFAVPGVMFLFESLEVWNTILYAPDRPTLEARIGEVARATRATRVVVDTDTERDFPPAEPLKLSPLDVQLLEALLADARVSFRALARRLGVEVSTLSRRYERLRREKALYMFPNGCPPLAGVVLGEIVGRIPSERKAAARTVAALDKAMPNAFIRFLGAKGFMDYVLFGDSLADLRGQFDEVQRIEGLREAEFRTFLRHLKNPAYAPWLATMVARHAERQGRAQPMPRPRATRGPS